MSKIKKKKEGKRMKLSKKVIEWPVRDRDERKRKRVGDGKLQREE